MKQKIVHQKENIFSLVMCLHTIGLDIRFIRTDIFSHDRIKRLFSSDDDDDSPCNIDQKIRFFLNHGISTLLVVNRVRCCFLP